MSSNVFYDVDADAGWRPGRQFGSNVPSELRAARDVIVIMQRLQRTSCDPVDWFGCYRSENAKRSGPDPQTDRLTMQEGKLNHVKVECLATD